MQYSINDKSIPFGISLPKSLLNLIDRERGDVTRSRFILRLVEKRVYPEKDSHSSSESKKNKIEKIGKYKLESTIGNDYPTNNTVKNSVTIEKMKRPVDHSSEAIDQKAPVVRSDD
jgi:hypothetical protein